MTSVNKSKLEYIWLDGNSPTQTIRSKTLIKRNFSGSIDDCPMWSFDGSSTSQADGSSSDCLLKPVAIFPDPDRVDGYLVMTEVLNPDGSPHKTNGRSTIDDDDDDFWFGFEQEYFFWDYEINNLWDSQKRVFLQDHKDLIIVVLVLKIPLVEKLLKLILINVWMLE